MCLGLFGFTKMCLGSGRVGLNGFGAGQISGRVLTRPIPTFWLNIHVFQEKSSGNTNQKSKRFQKMNEISKLFPNDYWERNGNIYP